MQLGDQHCDTANNRFGPASGLRIFSEPFPFCLVLICAQIGSLFNNRLHRKARVRCGLFPFSADPRIEPSGTRLSEVNAFVPRFVPAVAVLALKISDRLPDRLRFFSEANQGSLAHRYWSWHVLSEYKRA